MKTKSILIKDNQAQDDPEKLGQNATGKSPEIYDQLKREMQLLKEAIELVERIKAGIELTDQADEDLDDFFFC